MIDLAAVVDLQLSVTGDTSGVDVADRPSIDYGCSYGQENCLPLENEKLQLPAGKTSVATDDVANAVGAYSFNHVSCNIEKIHAPAATGYVVTPSVKYMIDGAEIKPLSVLKAGGEVDLLLLRV
ncbi:MAG: hypothetical protein LBP35_04100 [Candidatus Ancillula trichonymphae]|jgi:hypothetical protein|nr:hypothetical protein [Candidatus Ancillula trichonymphae]